MAQKSHFKMQGQGIFEYRKTFPQLPGNTVKDPKFIQTAHGNRLLTDGWWAWCRKPVSPFQLACEVTQTQIHWQNYTADWTMATLWGAIVGTASVIPYWYSVFFIIVLVHRCGRDFDRYVLSKVKRRTQL
jgi:Delta24(24(1))-sterol reductase